MSENPVQPPVDASPVMQLSTAYWGAQTLFTANRLDLFAKIAGGLRSTADIAAACDSETRAMDLLLKACASLGLLRESKGEFYTTALSEAVLVPGSQAYLGDAIRYSDDLYNTWGQLEGAVRAGRPQLPTAQYTGQDEARTRHFVRGMHDRALGIGGSMVGLVDLSGCKQMLDVGGGPGTYSSLFVLNTPGLQSTVLDLPGVVAIAREIVAEMGASEQVGFLAGDFNSTDFPGNNDVVLISGVFHRESTDGCRRLIHRASESLNPGGLLIVADVFTDDGGCSPPFATLFGLNMLLTAEDGGVHADADVAQWMHDAGFANTDIRPLAPPMPHRMVLGWKA